MTEPLSDFDLLQLERKVPELLEEYNLLWKMAEQSVLTHDREILARLAVKKNEEWLDAVMKLEEAKRGIEAVT